MSPPIREAYSLWPHFNARLVDTVSGLTAHEVLLTPAPERWPLWAVIGHLACQRVFSLCDLAGEPGAETTPSTNAAFNCPGDDDLENVLHAPQLAHALESTFAIVERCLDTWTLDSLGVEIRRTWSAETRVTTRGRLIQRTFTHDVTHIAEVNESLAAAGLPLIDLWN